MEIPISFVIGLCLVVAVITGVIGWAAWRGGLEWRDYSGTRWGRWGGLVVLWFGRVIAAVAAVNVVFAGVLIVASVGHWASEDAASESSVPAVFPELSGGIRRVGGVNGQKEAAANRQLRSEFPEVPGAKVVSVVDRYVTDEDSDDRIYAIGVATQWTYRVQGATKCQMADVLERPLTDRGWLQQTMETSGIPPEAGNIRLAKLYRSSSFIEISYGAPPSDFAITIQSVRRQKNGSKARAPEFVPSTRCVPDGPPAPPAKPVDRATALKANQKIYAALPIPAGATVTARNENAATALGNGAGGGNVPIGYGTEWTLEVPVGTDRCVLAAAFDTAMAKAGWERFTTQGPTGRDSLYFQPPRSVEVTWANGGLHILVMSNGAIVGTRQHPNPSAFSAGANPETRGAPVPCIP